MFYENYLRQLIRLRTDYWQLETVSQRNLKLSQMVLCANACGKDLIEFVLEAKNGNTKAEVSENQIVKDEIKANYPKAKSKFKLQKATIFSLTKYKCPYCDFKTESLKSLNGHQKRHSSKYQSLDIAV